ncbi:hypothetical protein GQ44DRAFT_696620 [Phaeosphaeriaceae sp. PMI808]|nr:hypothetical protein GQ44DRAFT_696620 [Phaeosphaeriaceae sp. PMI808]
MPVQTESEWTVIDPIPSRTSTMASTDNNISASAPGAGASATINTMPADMPTNDQKVTECACDSNIPKLARQDSIQSSDSDDAQYRRPRHRGVDPYIRPYSPSPIRRNRVIPIIRENPIHLASSKHLLDQVDKHDGIVDLPYPSRGNIYLTTYPFTNNDVKKWAWLFALNVYEINLQETSRTKNKFDGDSDSEDIVYPTARRGRNRSPFYTPTTVDLPSVYLSRALDKEIIPEDTKNITYLIVVQNRHSPSGTKLLVAESRKAAGIIMYYEVLKGDSIMFVGATVGLGKKRMPKSKFKKVTSLEEVAQASEEGFVGIVC